MGKTFDIHGGGLDLIFPHHENEIAQSCCAHGTDKMANVWMHNGYVQVEGKKMSKSDGNFVTIHDLLHTEKFGGRKWPGEVLRLAMLMTQYKDNDGGVFDFWLNSGSQIDGLIMKRLGFFKDKNFAEADRIRDELLEQGSQLKDGKDPETGERVTTWEVKR